jgi:folate-dependent phosphoribosylglycinamide formyltransferase PurN
MQAKHPARVVVMTAGGANPNAMINALAQHFADLHVIEESYETKGAILKRRAARLGWPVALGQLGTMIVSRLGKRAAARRSAEILAQYGLSSESNPSLPVTRVASLNDAQTHAEIARIKPDVVFTISCRLLTRATLALIPCPTINFHAGINPAYRGQMGGYWARVEEDEANFGATLHLVDAGTDTGETLAEIRVKPSAHDTISTYPLLLTAAGAQTTVQVLKDVAEGKAAARKPEGRSVLRFPPPLWTYVFHGLRRGIW